jgi:SAM-dependent methyltransferase
VTLVRLLALGLSPAEIAARLASAMSTPPELPQPAAHRRALELRRLIEEQPETCLRLEAMIRESDQAPAAHDAEGRLAACARLFDSLVAQSEEISVAACSVGDPGLLVAMTAEIVHLCDEWGVLGRHRTAVDLGCGIGRLTAALAERLQEITGVDLSPGMIARARDRCGAAAGVSLRVGSAHDLSWCGDAAVDLVLAVDSLPYVYRVGPELCDRAVAEAARVLRRGGDLLILNLCYAPGDIERRLAEKLAIRHGFIARVLGDTPLVLWDARAFHLHRR